MLDIKVVLKDAKNAIKDKDYEAALIHCKDALKIDRRNYLALTMFGRVCQEQHKYIDSKQALLFATQIDSSNPVAWQGLSSLHEKNEVIFSKEEEISILNHLKEVTKEEEKLERIFLRLANVYHKYKLTSEAIQELEKYISTLNSAEKTRNIRKLIIKLLEDINYPTNEDILMLIENYEAVLDQSPLGENEVNYKTYLRLIYKSKNYKKLVKSSLVMFSIFPTAYSLEFLLRAYVECSKSKEVQNLLPIEIVSQYIDKLLTMNRESSWGNLAKGLLHREREEMEDAMIYLRKGSELLGRNLFAWLILLEVQSEGNDLIGIEITIRRILKLIKTNSVDLVLPSSVTNLEILENSLLLKQATVLVQIGHTNHLCQAAAILEKVPQKDIETSIMYIKTLMKINKIEQAQTALEKLKKEYPHSLLLREVIAFVARCSGDMETAKEIYEEVLQQAPINSEALFELGRIYFDMKDYQKSLIFLLKAANLNPKMSFSYLYIGHYYRLFDNLDKARKCYEKAFHLNPTDDEVGAALSDIYRATEDHDSNLTLLVQVTSKCGRSGSGWAWLRLGLHHLFQKNSIEAIQALQCALEINKLDRICYECLGEAYLARGSHTAALKVFSKAVELNPKEALYSSCKIAHINHLIGEFLISVSQYEKVLSEKLPDALRTVALVGLAEVLLARGTHYKQQQLLSNLKDDCLKAIRCLTSAVSIGEGKNVTVWKLLGDACTMQSVIPVSLSKFSVPSRLLDPSIQDNESISEIDKGDMIKLGERCYSVGLHISKANASLWHDLGVNIFLQSYESVRANHVVPFSDLVANEDFQKGCDRSLTAIKNSITIDSSNFNVWNSLGVTAFFQGNYQLSQHAFIHSLELQPSVEGWTHLGALYFIQKDIHLAHEAFSQAQALDPGFVVCWVGQAMVADAVGHYEALDLYRHTTLLGIHPESSLGHANKVLQIACQSTKNDVSSSNIKSLLPNVLDCMIYYTREHEIDVVGLNLCGLSFEILGMKRSASDFYAKAVSCCKDEVMPSELMDKVLMNYGRILSSLNRLQESVDCYSQMSQPDFHSQCGLALARLKAGQYEDAYQKYTEALVWLAPDDIHKSHVLVALAFLQYKFNNIEQVKTLLFQSSSVLGLLALTALGLLQGDITLTEAALCELKQYDDDAEYVHHIAFLKASQAILQSDYQKGKLILSHAILRHPQNASLWRFLSHYLLTVAKTQSGTALVKIARAAKDAASAATALSQASGENDKVAEDVVMKAMAYSQATQGLQSPQETVRPKKGKNKVNKAKVPLPWLTIEQARIAFLNEAQRAVFMYPSKPESWAMLIAAMKTKSQKTLQLARHWSSEAKPPLKSWLDSLQM